jgi:hypothetical protein
VERLQVWLQNVTTELASREATYYGQCIALDTCTSSPTLYR